MSKKERLTDEELFAQLEGISGDPSAKAAGKPAAAGQPSGEDLLEELGIPERSKPSSRPHTPRVGSTSTTPAIRSSPKVSGTATPPNDGARSSEEKAHTRKSGESSRSFHNSFTPATTEEGELVGCHNSHRKRSRQASRDACEGDPAQRRSPEMGGAS